MNVPLACSFWLQFVKGWLTRLEIITDGDKTRVYGCSPSTRQLSSRLEVLILPLLLPPYLPFCDRKQRCQRPKKVSHLPWLCSTRSALPSTRPETPLRGSVSYRTAVLEIWGNASMSQGHTSLLISVCCQFSAKQSFQRAIQPRYPPNMIPRQIAIIRRLFW